MLKLILILACSAISLGVWAQESSESTEEATEVTELDDRGGFFNGGPRYPNRPSSTRPYNRPNRPYDKPSSNNPYGRPSTNSYDRPGGNRPRPPQGSLEPFVFEEDGLNRQSSRSMQVLYSWKQLDFDFPNEGVRERMIRNREFVPINNLILDVDVYGDGPDKKVFVSLPRVRPGVPVTLAKVSQYKRKNGAYLLEPFPDWRSHTDPRCDNKITSVFRTHIDECGRLWVLDSGSLNAFAGNGTIACQPKVLIYDINGNSNRLLGKYPIPRSMISDNTLLVTIAVDIRNRQCDDAFAYIADSIAYKMIVFNLRNRQYWRINSILFFPYPDQSRFTVNGVSFDLMGGVFGLALGPLHRGNKRILYFHSIDSVKQSWADTDDLRNQSLWRDNMNAKPRAFNLFSGTRPSQSAAATMNEQGIMFFGLIGTNEIACWNSQNKFGRQNIVSLAKDDKTLQFNSGIKVYGNKVYAATNRLQNYLNNQIPPTEENYRVLMGDVVQMTRQTKCEVDPFLSNRFDDDYSPDAESVDFEPNSSSPP